MAQGLAPTPVAEEDGRGSGLELIEETLGLGEVLQACLQHPTHTVDICDKDEGLVARVVAARRRVAGDWKALLEDALSAYAGGRGHHEFWTLKEAELSFDPDAVVKGERRFYLTDKGRKVWEDQ